MNIHGLDNPSLLVIFDKLAVENLLRAGRVCSRWNLIRHKSALSRQSLTLLVGENAKDRIDNSKLDNIPYGHLLTDDYEMPLLPARKCEDAQNQIVRSRISSFHAKFLAHLFPNITNFTVSIKSDTKSVHSLICLLKLWSTESKLTTLKLYTYDQTNKKQLLGQIGRALVSANRCLLSTINSITSLRVLTFDIDSFLFYVKANLYVGEVELEFPMLLNKLESIHLNSWDFYWDSGKLVDILALLDNANDNLKKIGINYISEYMLSEDLNNWISKISPKLARCFTRMCLNIDDVNISLFSPFCAHFCNFTTLQLNLINVVHFDPLDIYRQIDSLTQLINLTIKADILNFDALRIAPNQNAMYMLSRPNRTNSVKVLKLELISEQLDKDYDIFDSLLLSKAFPSVQVFIFELIPTDSTQSAIGHCDISVLRRVLFWCTNGFESIKMIRSINPDKEWSMDEIEDNRDEDAEGDEDDDNDLNGEIA